MSNVEFWIRDFPSQTRQAIMEAVETARLAKVRRALRLFGQLAPELRGTQFKVELLSTYSLEPVLPTLELALSCLPCQAQLQLAPLNDIEGYVSGTTDRSSTEIPNARVVLWRVEEFAPEVLFPLSHAFPDRSPVDDAIQRMRRVVSLHKRHAPGMPLFLSTLALPQNMANPIFASQYSTGAFSAVGRVNQAIYELTSNEGGVHILDVCAWAASGGKNYTDPLLDFMARQPLSAQGQMAFGLFLARCLRPLIFPRAKVLALDLDDTLWGGVVGEDGVNGLQLGHDFPGNVHLRIQRELVELRNRGILLVLLSKNNEADARLAFDSLPEMLLKWDDFTVRQVDWNHKHENLRAAAHELGLGLDSFVFLDDSDYEREQMRQMIPEVRILNESGDPLQMLRALWETDAFDSLSITAEDRTRHADYSVRGARDAQAHGDDLESFLRSLGMEAAIEEIGPANMERVVSMLGKTNQFNLTTRRHSHAELQRLLESGCIALALRLRDKFGDQGIVAALLAVPVENGRTLEIDSFLVSCRALGRGVEDSLWADFVRRAIQKNATRLKASYIPTAKNSIVSELYDRLGLKRVTEDSFATTYALDPVAAAKWPSWIASKNGMYGK